MTGPKDEAAVTDRLRRALLGFRTARQVLVKAHRRLKGLPQAEVEAYWAGPGTRVEAHLRLAAREVVAAFEAFSAAGLVADIGDRRVVAEAQHHLAEGG
jgi:hypothetical protein